MYTSKKVEAYNHVVAAANILGTTALHNTVKELAMEISIFDIYYHDEDWDEFINEWKHQYKRADLLNQNALLRDLLVQYSSAEILSELQDWLQEEYY